MDDIELFECPLCGGTGLLEEENGWCMYVTCLDCGCHTVETPFDSQENKEDAARRAAHAWNTGKVIFQGLGD